MTTNCNKKVAVLLFSFSAILAANANAVDNEVTAATATPTPTPNASDTPTEYRYVPTGKPDPFKPSAFATATLQNGNQLMSMDLREMRLVGTALGSEMSAIIMNGKNGIIARVGDKIGRAGGRIVSISSDKIVVRQPMGESGFAGTNGTKFSRQKFEDVTIPISTPKIEASAGTPGTTTPNSPSAGTIGSLNLATTPAPMPTPDYARTDASGSFSTTSTTNLAAPIMGNGVR